MNLYHSVQPFYQGNIYVCIYPGAKKYESVRNSSVNEKEQIVLDAKVFLSHYTTTWLTSWLWSYFTYVSWILKVDTSWRTLWRKEWRRRICNTFSFMWLFQLSWTKQYNCTIIAAVIYLCKWILRNKYTNKYPDYLRQSGLFKNGQPILGHYIETNIRDIPEKRAELRERERDRWNKFYDLKSELHDSGIYK